MAKIEVGQIYKQPNGLRYVVTHMRIDNIHLIYNTGYCTQYPLSSMWDNNDDKLVAEYSSWQAAVNSKEFNGE